MFFEFSNEEPVSEYPELAECRQSWGAILRVVVYDLLTIEEVNEQAENERIYIVELHALSLTLLKASGERCFEEIRRVADALFVDPESMGFGRSGIVTGPRCNGDANDCITLGRSACQVIAAGEVDICIQLRSDGHSVLAVLSLSHIQR
jgi:hypothetical protein